MSTPETRFSSAPSAWQRWLAGWRDRRLAALPDRQFCRRVSLDGWPVIATASAGRQGLLIAVGGELPRTAERALRLFAAALPLADLPAPRAAEALAAGAVLFAAAGSAQLGHAALPPNARQLTASAASVPGGRARIRVEPETP